MKQFVRAVAVAVVTAVVVMTGCSTESDTPGQPQITDARLTAFESDAALESYLKQAIGAQTDATRGGGGGALDGVPGGDGAPGAPSPESVFSTTNLQEAGVDEADRIKTDGTHVYVIERGGVVPEPAPLGVAASAGHRIRVLRLSSGPERAEEVAVIESEIDRLNGGYLLTQRDAGLSDVFVAIGGEFSYQFGGAEWFFPWIWRAGKTEVQIFDVADPANPTAMTRISLDGHLVSSRRIGEMLYLATRHTPTIPDYIPFPVTQDDEARNSRLLEAATLADLLPAWQRNAEESQPLVKATDCFLPPMETDKLRSQDIVTVVAIDVRQPETPAATRCIVGSSETMYVSSSAMYLATTRYGYVSDVIGAFVDYPTRITTDIHKFALTDGGIAYRASGAVEGHLGWEQDKKSFRMGEHNDVLRIATSQGRFWGGGDPDTRVTLLRESASDSALLEKLSVLPNEQRPEPIGAPGERLYAARFVGERAYLVTFQIVDPFYVLDLSDPADPRIAGSLKIPGYSDYLHPIGDALVIGIGKDAVPAGPEFGDGRGAWYQGVKISLFDTSDPSAPREVDSHIIGKRGTEADVLRDHHGFAFVPANGATPARLVLPLQLHDTDTGTEPGPSKFYEWTHSGAHMFDIHDGVTGAPEIIEAGQLIIDSRASGREFPAVISGTNRAVIRDDGVHVLHDNAIWSAGWGDPNTLVGPQ